MDMLHSVFWWSLWFLFLFSNRYESRPLMVPNILLKVGLTLLWDLSATCHLHPKFQIYILRNFNLQVGSKGCPIWPNPTLGEMQNSPIDALVPQIYVSLHTKINISVILCYTLRLLLDIILVLWDYWSSKGPVTMSSDNKYYKLYYRVLINNIWYCRWYIWCCSMPTPLKSL